MSAEIRPCPFCGCASVGVREGSTFRWRFAQCEGCGAQSGEIRINTISHDRVKSEADASAAAIKEWNTRAQ